MKKITTLILLVLLFSNINTYSQCDGTLPFVENDGVLFIDPELGNLTTDWKIFSGESLPAPLNNTTITDYTGDGAIYWYGEEFFRSPLGDEIVYNIKINTPGTYQLQMRMAIGYDNGLANNRTEHNDVWVKITADNYFALNNDGEEPIKPRPECVTDPDYGCPEGRSDLGFFKVFHNMLSYAWGSRTSDNANPYYTIYATFDNPGDYQVILDARSSYCIVDRIMLRIDTSRNFGRGQSDLLSNCSVLSVSDNTYTKDKITIYQNPYSELLHIDNLPVDGKRLILRNILGKTIKVLNINSPKTSINISNLQSGLYLITVETSSGLFTKKVLKQ